MLLPLTLLSFNHAALPTTRLAESIRFYRDVLGFQEISRPNFSFGGAWLYAAGMQIHLIVQNPEDQLSPATLIDTRNRHLAFAVGNVDAVEKLLVENGISYRRNLIADRNIHQIFMQDPDGNVVEVGQYGQIDR